MLILESKDLSKHAQKANQVKKNIELIFDLINYTNKFNYGGNGLHSTISKWSFIKYVPSLTIITEDVIFTLLISPFVSLWKL